MANQNDVAGNFHQLHGMLFALDSSRIKFISQTNHLGIVIAELSCPKTSRFGSSGFSLFGLDFCILFRHW
ncbi:hypothetical protein V6N13_012329 [Hibiscus sabdariffa]|uniref:Uncharacterized protein n=1 Tax=Hibiscus sabdariffa TaxID=183260 RepID=A0ABR2SEY1_9ROSI